MVAGNWPANSCGFCVCFIAENSAVDKRLTNVQVNQRSVLYRLFVCFFLFFFLFFPFLHYVILCVSVFFRQYKWPSGPSVADFK